MWLSPLYAVASLRLWLGHFALMALGIDMKIAAVTPTWNRPKLLGRLIECFNRQDHEDRRLLILSDNDQYRNQEGDRWKLVSQRFRYKTLGDKRNAAVRLAVETWPGIDAIACFDDDDIYHPYHLSACVAALRGSQWTRPSQVLIADGKRFKRMSTVSTNDHNDIGYPASWAWQRGVFEKLGGYAAISNGEDQEIAKRALNLLGPSADTISPQYPTPSYAYNTSGQHLSAMGPDGYAKLGKQHIEPVDHLDISWPEDYSKWPIGDEILPRPW